MMMSFIQQVFTLLTSDPGNLTYHLVLAFSIAGALQVAIFREWGADIRRGKRLLVGLILLLLLRILLFLGAGLAWQRISQAEYLLPLVDRVVSFLGVVIITWLWAYPEPKRAADWMFSLVGALSLTISLWGILLWVNLGSHQTVNGSWFDLYASAMTGFFLCLGGLFLVIRRQSGWLTGLFLLLILAGGYVLHYYTLPQNGDYSGAVRLSQLIAYPLLLLLPQRAASRNVHTTGEELSRTPTLEQDKVDRSLKAFDWQSWKPLFELGADAPLEQVWQTMAGCLCRGMGAEVCVLLSPPDSATRLQVLAVYQGDTTQPCPAGAFETVQIPVIAAAFRQGRAFRLPASSTSPDVASLARLLSMDRIGHVLAAPVLTSNGRAALGIVLLSPVADERPWKVEHQHQLGEATHILAYILQHAEHVASLQAELAQTRLDVISAQEQVKSGMSEQHRLMDLVTTLRQKLDTTNVDAWPQPSDELEQVKGELQLALQELASLREEPGSKFSVASPTKQVELEQMKTSLQAMSRSLDDMMHAVAAQLTQAPSASVSYQLDDLLKECVEQVSARFAGKRMRIEVNKSGRLPSVSTNRSLLMSILTNFLSEAGLALPDESCLDLNVRYSAAIGNPGRLEFHLTSIASLLPNAWLPESADDTGASHDTPGKIEFVKGQFTVEPLITSAGGRLWIDQDAQGGSVVHVVMPVEVNPLSLHPDPPDRIEAA